MPSLRKFTQPDPVFPVSEFYAAGSETKYYFEDGWVFREHHGRYIECVCRLEDAKRNGISVPRTLRLAANNSPV